MILIVFQIDTYRVEFEISTSTTECIHTTSHDRTQYILMMAIFWVLFHKFSNFCIPAEYSQNAIENLKYHRLGNFHIKIICVKNVCVIFAVRSIREIFF